MPRCLFLVRDIWTCTFRHATSWCSRCWASPDWESVMVRDADTSNCILVILWSKPSRTLHLHVPLHTARMFSINLIYDFPAIMRGMICQKSGLRIYCGSPCIEDVHMAVCHLFQTLLLSKETLPTSLNHAIYSGLFWVLSNISLVYFKFMMGFVQTSRPVAAAARIDATCVLFVRLNTHEDAHLV